jgi:lipopolysaccharide transport system permease protein
VLRNLFRYRRYIFDTFWTDLRFRYSGTALGFFWFIVSPLLEVAIYAVVFSQLVSIRSGGGRDISYVIYLVSGLFPFLAFSQMISRGSNAINANALYMRRSLIPAEVFVFKEVLISGFSLFIYLVFLIPVSLAVHNPITWHILFFPVFVALFSLFGFGVSMALANLRVLIPDLGEVISVIIQLWRWTLPIMYVDTNFPERLKLLIRINPPYYFIQSFRDMMIEHTIPAMDGWLFMFFWIGVALLIAGWITRQLRSEVKDLI